MFNTCSRNSCSVLNEPYIDQYRVSPASVGFGLNRFPFCCPAVNLSRTPKSCNIAELIRRIRGRPADRACAFGIQPLVCEWLEQRIRFARRDPASGLRFPGRGALRRFHASCKLRRSCTRHMDLRRLTVSIQHSFNMLAVKRIVSAVAL